MHLNWARFLHKSAQNTTFGPKRGKFAFLSDIWYYAFFMIIGSGHGLLFLPCEVETGSQSQSTKASGISG